MPTTRAVAGLCCAGVSAMFAGCGAPATPLDELVAEGQLTRADVMERSNRIVYIDNTADLQRHIGDEGTVLLLATTSTDEGGNYVIPACTKRKHETTNKYCGQMTLGHGSWLVGELEPEMDGTYPTGVVARPGPLIDCGALKNYQTCPADEPDCNRWEDDDHNGWDLACIEMTSGVVWGVAIDNGDDAIRPELGPQVHRNAINVKPNGGSTLVGRCLLTDARRGVLHWANTHLTAYQLIIRRTELAGVFTLNGDPDLPNPPSAVSDSHVTVEVTSTWLEHIGRISLLLYWGVGGDSNSTDAVFRYDVVTPDSRHGVFALGNSFQDPTPVTNTEARFLLEDSRLEPFEIGLLMEMNGFADSDDLLVGDVRDVTFANSTAPVTAVHGPWADSASYLAMTGTEYLGATPGSMTSCQYVDPSRECVEEGPDPRWRLAGTLEEFQADNDNWDTSLIEDHFTGEPLPD